MREPSGDHAGDAQHPAAAKLAIERVGGAEGLLQPVAEIHQGARREGSRPKLPIRTPTRHSRAVHSSSITDERAILNVPHMDWKERTPSQHSIHRERIPETAKEPVTRRFPRMWGKLCDQ
jgi:hypothetical protein